MAVRTKRLAAGTVAAATTGTIVLYTCPAGETAILKSLVAESGGTLSARFQLAVPGGAAPGLWLVSLTPDQPADKAGWWVLSPGDVVQVVKTATGASLRYWLSGTELQGTAD
jgi:hypothetical protein